MFLINPYIIQKSSVPIASSVIVLEDAGIYSLDYTYSHPASTIEASRAPEVDLLTISGTLEENSVLTALTTGFYSFTGRLEGTHTYEWFKGDDIQGTNKTSMGTGSTYTLLLADVGKYVWVEMVVKEVGGSVDGSMVSTFSQTVVLALPTNNFVMGIIEDDNDKILHLVLDGNVTITDATGLTVTTGGLGNAIVSVDAPVAGKTLKITLTNSVLNAEAILVSYVEGTGNMFVNGTNAGSFTNEVGINRVGAIFSTKIQVNISPYGTANIAGNWNNITGGEADIGIEFADMIDDAGVTTGIGLETIDAWNQHGNDLVGDTSINFPSPAYDRWFQNYSPTVLDKARYEVTGFSANQWVRLTMANRPFVSKDKKIKIIGDFTYEQEFLSFRGESQISVQADVSGVLSFEDSMVTTNSSNGLSGFIIEY